MRLTIFKSILIGGFLVFLFVSFSCLPNSFRILKETHNPELNNKCTISGYILDKAVKDHIIGATIILNSGEYEAYSNVDGFFTFKDIPAGIYKITVKFVGYKTVNKSSFHVKSNYIYELNIELAPDW